MRNKIIYIAILLLSCNALFSQKTMHEYDSISHEYYGTSDWKSLIMLSKKAKQENMSFYMLDYRIGVALFERNNFAKAIPYFENLLEQKKSDPFIYNYLYYSYVGTNQQRKAYRLKKLVPANIDVSFNIDPPKKVKSSSLLYTTSLFNTNEFKNSYLKGTDSIYGEMPNTPIHNNSISFYSSFALTPYLQIQVSATQFKSLYFQRFSHNDTEKYYENNTDQKQVYLQLETESINGWGFSLSGHLLSVHPEFYTAHCDTSYYTQKIIYPANDTQQYEAIYEYYNINKYTLVPDKQNETSIDYTINANISKKTGYFFSQVDFSYSTLWKKRIVQADATLSLYPFGNNRTELTAIYKYKNELESDSNNGNLLTFSIRKRVLPMVYFSLQYSQGNISEYTSYEGNAVYNSTYRLQNAIETGLTFSFFKDRLYWFSSFSLNKFQSSYYCYNITGFKTIPITERETIIYPDKVETNQTPTSYDEPTLSPYSKTIRFTNYFIKTGLSWYF